VTKGPWGWDFGVLETATEALLSGFVRLYWPDHSCGRIDRKAVEEATMRFASYVGGLRRCTA
jgi:hypothetical protein